MVKAIAIDKKIPIDESVEELLKSRDRLYDQLDKQKAKNSELNKSLREREREIEGLLARIAQMEEMSDRQDTLARTEGLIDVVAIPKYCDGIFINPPKLKDKGLPIPFKVDGDRCYHYKIGKEQAAKICCMNPDRYVFIGPEEINELYASKRINGMEHIINAYRMKKVVVDGIVQFIKA